MNLRSVPRGFSAAPSCLLISPALAWAVAIVCSFLHEKYCSGMGSAAVSVRKNLFQHGFSHGLFPGAPPLPLFLDYGREEELFLTLCCSILLSPSCIFCSYTIPEIPPFWLRVGLLEPTGTSCACLNAASVPPLRVCSSSISISSPCCEHTGQGSYHILQL